MKTPNVIDTGHLTEQATKISAFSPQLAVFHGYMYKRVSTSVIHVWVEGLCECCEQSIGLSQQFVRTGNQTDENIQRHGIRLASGDVPLSGSRPHTSAPYMCDPCRAKWLKGEGLERTFVLGEGKAWS